MFVSVLCCGESFVHRVCMHCNNLELFISSHDRPRHHSVTQKKNNSEKPKAGEDEFVGMCVCGCLCVLKKYPEEALDSGRAEIPNAEIGTTADSWATIPESLEEEEDVTTICHQAFS